MQVAGRSIARFSTENPVDPLCRWFQRSANVAVEQQGVIYPVRIFAIAAYGYVDIKANIGIDDAEGNGVRGSVFVSDDLLDVEVVNALVFPGTAAESYTTLHLFERALDVAPNGP